MQTAEDKVARLEAQPHALKGLSIRELQCRVEETEAAASRQAYSLVLCLSLLVFHPKCCPFHAAYFKAIHQ